MRFMGGAVVFPGGAVAEADADPRWAHAAALDPRAAARALREADERQALAVHICALRESFEEVGLLVAEGPVAELGRDAAADPETFLQRCLELGIVLRADELVPVGRWVTPEPSPVRFDTRFFVVRAPDGWEPSPDPYEVDGCTWSTPSGALEKLATGRAVMAPPTIEMLQRLQDAPDVERALRGLVEARGGVVAARLSPLVASVVAPNPGPLTGPGTNTYVVGARGRTIVIDPAVDDAAYLDAVCGFGGEVEAIVVTHRHPDHVGGVAALELRTEAPVLAFGPAAAGGVEVRPLGDGDRVRVPGATLVAHHSPGHAPDHLSFWLAEESALFCGDNVLGEGTTMIAPPEGDMGAYLATLERLARLDAGRLYPGHFRMRDDARAVIGELVAHRRAREAKVLAALEDGAHSLGEIVARAYDDTPPDRHELAAQSTLAHLELLREADKVRRRGQVWERTNST
jgi:glyoxylase-like metal-dependent hydrolase (beta-lactamase superfamily II)/8-oxo-dGTP pyrophosphatase MutT (NUDIX family)